MSGVYRQANDKTCRDNMDMLIDELHRLGRTGGTMFLSSGRFALVMLYLLHASRLTCDEIQQKIHARIIDLVIREDIMPSTAQMLNAKVLIVAGAPDNAPEPGRYIAGPAPAHPAKKIPVGSTTNAPTRQCLRMHARALPPQPPQPPQPQPQHSTLGLAMSLRESLAPAGYPGLERLLSRASRCCSQG